MHFGGPRRWDLTALLPMADWHWTQATAPRGKRLGTYTPRDWDEVDRDIRSRLV